MPHFANSNYQYDAAYMTKLRLIGKLLLEAS